MRTLLPYQTRWVQDRAPLKVCVKGRRIGLSWAEAYDSVMHAGAGGGDVTYQSYAHDMTRGFIDDCASWAGELQIAADVVGETFLDLDGEQVPAYRLPFASGSQVTAVTSAPRAFRSRGRPGDRAILDEAAFVDSLEESLKSALAYLVWGGAVRVMSTHNGESTAFAALARSIESGERSGSLHRIPFRGAVEEGLYRRICRETGQAHTAEAEAAWVQEVYDTYGSGAEEELDCIPSPLGGAWLPWELLRSCEVECPEPRVDEGGRRTVRGDRGASTGGAAYIGVDIGRRRDLWVAWVLELVGDVAWTREIRELRDTPFSSHDDELDELVEYYRPVRISMDQTGMGEKPVEDARRRYGAHRLEGVLLTSPRRLALATALKERYEDRAWRVPRDRVIRQDMHSIRVAQGATGAPRLAVDGAQKESHADRFWAAALAAGAAASPERVYAYRPARPEAARSPVPGRLRLRPPRDEDTRRVPDRFGAVAGRARFGRGLP